MTDKPNSDQETAGDEPTSDLNRDFADALGSILDSASGMFPNAEELDIRFSVALVGEMGKDEFLGLVKEAPVVAVIALRKEIGDKAAIMTDVATASNLASAISSGKPTPSDELSEDDLVSLFEAFGPVVEALSSACEEVLGEQLGAIENLEVYEPSALESVAEELAESLCRATASISIHSEDVGKLIFILPTTLAESLAEAKAASGGAEVSEYEQAELQQDEIDALFRQVQGEEEPAADVSAEPSLPPVESHEISQPTPMARESAPQNINLLMDVELKLTARLGRVEMPISEILKLAPGSVLDIDRFVDEPIELVVNNRPIARGEIVVVQENFGVRISEIISPKERIESLR